MVNELSRIAYLGPAGTFTEQALRTLPESHQAVLAPTISISEALDAVRGGAANGALVPLENSVEGGVNATLDDLTHGTVLTIAKEVSLPVAFGLCVQEGKALDEISTVGTHPHAEAQCRGWLRQNLPNAEFIRASSTADAAVDVARGMYDAAICAEIAGRENGLTCLARDIGDNSGAVTRFILVKPPGPPSAPTGHDITSLVVFAADDHVGVLLQVLTQFAVRGVNLTRIESRPTKELLGKYCFFLDCEGHISEHRIGEALMGLHRVCAAVRYLGSYPRAGEPRRAQIEHTADKDFCDANQWLHRIREHGQ